METVPGNLLEDTETPGSGEDATGARRTQSLPPDRDAPASAEESGPLANLSPSRASDFKTCPQLFKFRHVDKLPAVPTPAQARGTAVHLALERLFLLPPAERHPERLLELFDVAWEDTLQKDEYREVFADDPESREDFHRSSRKVAEKYFQIEDPRTLEPLERELHISLMIDEGDSRRDNHKQLEIRGVIDRLDPAPGGGLVITDYKTGRAPPLRFADSGFFALKVYALMVQENRQKTPDLVRLLYLGSSEAHSLPVSATQLRGVKKQLRALWWAIDRAISTGAFPTRKTRLCDWCSYQSICPAWAEEPSSPDPADR
ncbi:MAG: PD-(D/E)XK nuclease family protein [Acidimicrobiia bacterium]|nr:PD-(D/E)XK nuclease family protein [Acidimicrobiia bacterium]